MPYNTRKPTGHPYENLLHEFQFTWLSDMYREAGNHRMSNKVSLYEAALGGNLVAYRNNRPGCSVDLHFFGKDSTFLWEMVACDVGVGDLDAAVDSALEALCIKHGVHKSELRMKLELMGN